MTRNDFDDSIIVKKVDGIGSDFIKGVDVSSYITLADSGVVFYNYEGQELDATGFFKLFADAGVNYVRIRIWNDPKNASGEYYGGGNNDLETAKKICSQIQAYNTQYSDTVKVLIDFHYSDFWVDPDKQKAPKAWADLPLAEKTEALKEFTKSSLASIAETGITVGMVQIGNETNNGICGETQIGTAGQGMCAVFQAGCEAVAEYNAANGTDILRVVHFTDPHKQDNAVYNAKTLLENGVDYDVYATSYYPYWHGTTSELSEVLNKIAKATGKKVMVAETQEIYTNADGDGFDNQAYEGKNNIDLSAYPVSVQGQADEFRNVIAAVASVGEQGIGMFYWEPAWLPVGYAYKEDGTKDEAVFEKNQELWRTKGSGWAAPAAEEFDESVAQWGYGGTNCENAALFDFYGHPLPSLKVFRYADRGTAGAAEAFYRYRFPVTAVAAKTGMQADQLQELLPQQAEVITNYGNQQTCAVVWDQTRLGEIAAAIADNTSAGNTYTATGLVQIGNDSRAVTMQIEVVPSENRLVNGDFESSNTGWNFGSYTYAKEEPTNSKGTTSCDFSTYNITEEVPYTTTVTQTVTITEPGSYGLIGFAEGTAGTGDTKLGEKIILQATDSTGKQYTSNNLQLQGWMIWQKASIENIQITKEMIDANANTLEIAWVLTLNESRWGTLDDTYLFQTEKFSDDNQNGDDPGNNSGSDNNAGSDSDNNAGSSSGNDPGSDSGNDPDNSSGNNPGNSSGNGTGSSSGGTGSSGNGTGSSSGNGTGSSSGSAGNSTGSSAGSNSGGYYGNSSGTAPAGTGTTDTGTNGAKPSEGQSSENQPPANNEEVTYDITRTADGTLQITGSDGNKVQNTFVTLSDGSLCYAQQNGTAAANQIVNADEKKYYAKADGRIARNEFCTTAKGSMVYAGDDGSLAKDRTITVAGKKYYAKTNCAIAKSGFYTTAKGSKIYAKATGELITAKIFRVDGDRYYAKPSGAVIRNTFYTLDSGQKVYARESGKLMRQCIFTVRGKQFYADKNGFLIKQKWVTVKGRNYYCSASYKITKDKKAS